MKRLPTLTILLAGILLGACAGAEAGSPPAFENDREATLKNYGSAPELTNMVWLNTDRPLRLADLRGQVVLIDFWTFG